MTSQSPTHTTPGQWCFKIVAAFDDLMPELKVQFIGDVSLRPISEPQERWWTLELLSMSQRLGIAIGVLFGEDNRILDLGTIHGERVEELSQNPRHPHLTDVQFEGMAPPKHLWKQHPKYEEMLRQLREAAVSQVLVWHVIQGATIVDIKILSQEEHEIICRWMWESARRAEAMRSNGGRR